MKPARNLILTVLLSVAAATAGAWGVAHMVLRRSEPATAFHQMLHKDLRLTADQDRRIEGLEQDHALRRRALEAQMRAANADLARALKQGHAYTPAVQQAVDRSHVAMAELQKATILHVLAMRQVLTADQAAQFDEIMAKALTEDTP